MQGNLYVSTCSMCVCETLSAVLQMKGEAEAFAVEAKAKAEAEQMEKKANAWKEYQDAAVVDMILEVLPKVCRSLTALLYISSFTCNELFCISRCSNKFRQFWASNHTAIMTVNVYRSCTR